MAFTLLGGVDQLLHLRSEMAGVTLLQLRNLPVGALDDLAAAVRLAVAVERELDRGSRIVVGEFFAHCERTARDEVGSGEPGVWVATVIHRPGDDDSGVEGGGGEHAESGDRRR